MGQSHSVYKPNKFQIKLSNWISDYLKQNGPIKRPHWERVALEAHERTRELTLEGMKYAKLERKEEVCNNSLLITRLQILNIL